jgi:predicted nucleic acid-binding protein
LKGWLLDTNIIASLTSPCGAPTVKAWVAAQDEQTLFLSVLSLAEYDKGIYQLPQNDPMRARYAANRDAIEARFGARVLPVSNAVIRRWGAITGRIKRETGHPPPVIDTMLAATALEANLYLVTRNTKDVTGTGAVVFNPWEDDPAAFAFAEGLGTSKPTIYG